MRCLAVGAVAVLCGVTAAGCEQDPARVQARGAGVSTALDALHSATTMTESIAARPASRCRAVALPDAGPVTIDVTIDIVLKHAASQQQPERTIAQWRRDADGDIAYRRELTTRMPDGRPVRRTTETRRVGERFYRAFDDRYVDAQRVANIDRDLADAAFADVDGLLSLIDRDNATWRSALPGRGLCRGEGARGLPAPVAASLTYAADGRSGWIEWSMDRPQLVVQFSERISHEALDVAAPDELFDVDPDPTWDALRSFVERGTDEGWLAPGRTFGDWTAHVNRSQEAGTGSGAAAAPVNDAGG